ncbi:putative leucine-rich repeat domain, L domain-containing protein [Medicago truncatula]|uniref:Putative leucine-rich repeat domain, L domain-containing protein n=1 Tax=Medicago truncatula TaxID=3880 RepID=A0A396IUU6_MEDTR|nr:putative leucine-rich repeat domain, L domain-containing protein [Medicago truncatula]
MPYRMSASELSKNARNLRSMRVVNCWEIKDAGFRKCVTKLPHLEELDISLMELTHDSLEVLARSCPLLKSLKLHIAEPVYRLSHFYMKDYDRSEVGWLAILDRCLLLESLDIRGGNVYFNENLKERCHEKIKNLRLSVRPSY